MCYVYGLHERKIHIEKHAHLVFSITVSSAMINEYHSIGSFAISYNRDRIVCCVNSHKQRIIVDKTIVSGSIM